MEMFLAIIGGLAIAFVLAVAVLFIWLRWKILRIAERAAETVVAEAVAKPSSVPPFRIKLKPVPIDWEAPDRVEELARPLRAAQFTEARTFVAAAADLRLMALCHPQEAAYAIIYEHPKVGVWSDLVTYYEDGSSATFTTGRDTLMDRPNHKLIRFFEGFGSEELLRSFLRERPRKPMIRILPDQFAERFERAYAEGMDFRIARGGPTEEEIRRIAERSGNPCSPEMVEAIRARWGAAIDRFRQGVSHNTALGGTLLSSVDREVDDGNES